MAIKGSAVSEVEAVYTRARMLGQQVSEPSQLFPALFGLWYFHFVRAEYQTAHELAKQMLALAQSVQDPTLLLEAHYTLGATLWMLGEWVQARETLEQSSAFYDPRLCRKLFKLYYMWE